MQNNIALLLKPLNLKIGRGVTLASYNNAKNALLRFNDKTASQSAMLANIQLWSVKYSKQAKACTTKYRFDSEVDFATMGL